MINSFLELIGALFLAALPVLVMLARIRRRRMRAEAARSGAGADRPGGDRPAETVRDRRRAPRRGSRLSRMLDRRPDSDLAPFVEQTGGGKPQGRAPARRGESRRGESSETRSGLEPQSFSGYRSPARTSPGDALLKRVNRYPPLQRAIVLKEILGPPKGLE
ncbi:MAG: hypothetical protein WD492_10570 [Alkalispirochaeta sp.]